MKKGILIILSLVSFPFIFAQNNDTQIPPPLTAPWEIIEVNEYPGIVPYPVVKESDVKWSMTIWREIDLREKRNHPLYFPTEPQGVYKSLGQVILDAIDVNNPDNEDALPVYTDEFCNVKTERANIKNALGNTKKLIIYNPETGEPIREEDKIEYFTSSEIMYYRLKEVWFFDQKRGVVDVRILEIEPFFEYEKDTGVGTGGVEDEDMQALKTKRRLGSIKYDELRPYLAQQLYYTPKNAAQKITFDDVLTWKRYFSSYIIASSTSPNNRQIQDYISNPRDQRLESERILNEIRNYESELWEY